MKYLFLLVSAAIMVALVIMAGYEQKQANISGAEPIRASIINDNPENFTIDVGFLSNSGANTNAEYFAVYTSNQKPSDCADFHDTDLTFQKPSQYKRIFDLSGHEDILEAIDTKQCVIIPNSDRAAG